MIKISHEFPLKYYLNGFASKHTDYDYILAHRYLSDEEYKKYALSQTNRDIITDNGLYEMGSAMTGDLYCSIIEELQPTYYFLPDVYDCYVENITSQVGFYKSFQGRIDYVSHKVTHKPVKTVTPIAICQGKTPIEIKNSFKDMDSEFPENVYFAITGTSSVWTNDEYNPITSKMVFDNDLRSALNRKIFIAENHELLSRRKIHLLGCRSLAEFSDWGNDFDKNFIVSMDTSLPVTMSFEGKELKGNEHYKPSYLIDKHFNDVNFTEGYLTENIEYFRNCVRKWEG